MLRGKRPFHSSYDSREESHWGRDTSSLGTSARIMLSAYLLFPHYTQWRSQDVCVARAKVSVDGAILRREFFCKTLHLFAVGTAVLMCFITLLGLLGTRLLPLNPIKRVCWLP